MTRRELIALFASTAAVGWPGKVWGQQPSSKMRRLGVLLFSTPQTDPQLEAIRRRLRELGYVEGQNLAIDYRYAEGKRERLPDLAADLVRANPNVLFSVGGDVTSVAVKATQSIPLVFISSADPVQLGFVAGLARPGGNATGVTLLLDELASKRLELFKEAAPGISRVAFVWNPDHVDNELHEAEHAAGRLGIELQRLPVRGPADFEPAFAAAANRVDAVYAVSSRLIVRNIDSIVHFAARNRVPLAGGWGAWAQQGALLSYGPNVEEMVERATTYVDRIFKGAKAADLPVQQPAKFELVLNVKIAKALGIEMPPTLLARADEVIE
jgi:ABC-type uncharacterized transport system substrate-binding protein